MTEDHPTTPRERTMLIEDILKLYTLGSPDPLKAGQLDRHLRKINEAYENDADVRSHLDKLRVHVDGLRHATSTNDLEAKKNALESALAANHALSFILAKKEQS